MGEKAAYHATAKIKVDYKIAVVCSRITRLQL